MARGLCPMSSLSHNFGQQMFLQRQQHLLSGRLLQVGLNLIYLNYYFSSKFPRRPNYGRTWAVANTPTLSFSWLIKQEN